MIYLQEGNSIQAVCSILPNVELDFVYSYYDQSVINTPKGTLTAGGKLSNAIRDIIPAPGSKVKRDVRSISLFNSDDQVQTINFYLLSGGTSISLHQCVLSPNEKIEFNSQDGWSLYDVNGLKKEININDIIISATPPSDPSLKQLWIDIS